MQTTTWALIRCKLEPQLAVELRLCIETLWALPALNTPFDVVVVPSSVLVSVAGTVELGVPYPADQRYFLRYLAPELVLETPTVAAAIYAVGALLFEAVSGIPFESSEAVEREVGYLAARAQATGLGPDTVDTRLLEIAARATRANPGARWATPEVLSRELDRVAGQRMATRADLARLVRGWVHGQRSGARAPSHPGAWRPASAFPPPREPLGEEVTRHVPKTSHHCTFAEARLTTLRGYALDLSAYPPPRLQVRLEHHSTKFRADPLRAAPPGSAPLDAQPVNDAGLGQLQRGQAAPASGVRPEANARRRPTQHRSAAVITALLVALPLLAMTLWNWRASAHAARGGVPVTAHHAPTSVHVVRPVSAAAPQAPLERISHDPPPQVCANCSDHRDRRAATETPARGPKRAEQRTSKRQPPLRPPPTYDYGI